MRPIVATQSTQHTLWQALTGQTPPLALPPTAIAHVVLDSRDVQPGDLFVAFVGEKADGHSYVGTALSRGAQAVICEERGRQQAIAQGAQIVDCTAGRWEMQATLPVDVSGCPLVYIVDSTLVALQKAGAFQRHHRCQPGLRVIGVTGSVGKTSTKELVAAVVSQRYRTQHSQGNLNGDQGLPMVLLGLDWSCERAVLEMGMYTLGEIATLCTLARPQVGIVTNIGPVHLERMGSIERIVQAKAELLQALPPAEAGGVAILNWDDERVRGMAAQTQARIFRYGLTPEADLWADDIVGEGLQGIRFRLHYQPQNQSQNQALGEREAETMLVRVPLLGQHSVHTALRAAAAGLVEGLTWEEILAGLQSATNQVRLVVVPGINGSTLIDDTYNASPDSVIAALNLLADLQPSGVGRRVAVLGDMRELGEYTDEGHQLVGGRAANVLDLLVTVGDLGRTIGEAAGEAGFASDQLHSFGEFAAAVAFLHGELGHHDLVLVKGSRAVGMEEIANELASHSASVWEK